MARALLMMVLVALSMVAVSRAQESMVVVAYGTLTINGTFTDILADTEATDSLEMALKNDFGNAMDIPSDMIVINSMTSGSLIAVFSIVVPASEVPSAEEMAQHAADFTEAINNLINNEDTEWLSETTALYRTETGDSEAVLVLTSASFTASAAGFAVATALLFVASFLALLA